VSKFYADPQTAHLQTTQANPQTQACKKKHFLFYAQTEMLTLNYKLKNK